MIKTTEESFKILVGTDDEDMFMFDSDRIDEGIAYIKKHNIRYVGINSFIGYKAPDIFFLSELRDFVEGISVPEAHFDISVLNELHRLVFLGFADDKKRLSLDLFVPNITSLAGIRKFPFLEGLTLYKARQLADISALEEVGFTLRNLEFDSCKHIGNYEALSEVTALKKLIIVNSSPIQSLSFVKTLVGLEFLSFVGTSVMDGDLSPTIGLKYVGFENKRHTPTLRRKFLGSRSVDDHGTAATRTIRQEVVNRGVGFETTGTDALRKMGSRSDDSRTHLFCRY